MPQYEDLQMIRQAAGLTAAEPQTETGSAEQPEDDGMIISVGAAKLAAADYNALQREKETAEAQAALDDAHDNLDQAVEMADGVMPNPQSQKEIDAARKREETSYLGQTMSSLRRQLPDDVVSSMGSFRELNEKTGLPRSVVAKDMRGAQLFLKEKQQQENWKTFTDDIQLSPDTVEFLRESDDIVEQMSISMDKLALFYEKTIREVTGSGDYFGRSVVDTVSSSWDAGMLQRQVNNLWLKEMRGQKLTEEEQKNLTDWTRALEYLDKKGKEVPFWRSALSATVGSLGVPMAGMAEGAVKGMRDYGPTAMAAGAGVGAAMGSMAGGVGALPGAALGAGKGLVASAMAGGMSDMAEQEAAGLYGTLKRISDEEGRVIDDDTARAIAMAYGATAGLLEFAGEGAVAALLVPQLRKFLANNTANRALQALLKSPVGKTAWGKALKTGLKTYGVENATEVSQTIAENTGRHIALGLSDVNQAQKSGEEWLEDIWDTVKETSKAMLIPTVLGGGVHAVHYSRSRQDEILAMGQRRLKVNDTTAEFMQNSEAAKSDPVSTENLMHALQDSGTLPEQVYVNPEKLQEVFYQDGNEELMQVAEKMGVTPEKINEAMALGTDVAIDYSKAAAGIMSDKMRYAKLRNEMRLDPSDPNGMELEEIQKLNATEEGHLRELEGVVKAIQDDEQKAQKRYEERLDIAKDYIEQMERTGLTKEQAAAYGVVLAAAAQRMAPAFGMTPAEYFRQRFAGYVSMPQAEFEAMIAKEAGQEKLSQPLNPGVDLDAPVTVVKITPRFAGKDPKVLRKRFPKDIKQDVLTKFKNGIVNDETQKTIGLSSNNFREHLKFEDDGAVDGLAQLEAIAALPELVKTARLVETYPDQKKPIHHGGTEPIKNMHRFQGAVRIGDKDYSVKLTVKEHNDGTLSIDDRFPIKLYHHRLEKEMPASNSPTTTTSATSGPLAGTSEYSLRSLLEDVNDSKGNPFFQYENMSPEELNAELESMDEQVDDILNRESAGPEVQDPVSLSPVLYQIQDIPEWRELTAAWMKAHDYTQEEIDERLAAMDGQLNLQAALADKISRIMIGADVARRKSQKGYVTSGAVRGNIDPIYRLSFDLSSQCVKRLSSARTVNMVQKELGRPLTAGEQMALIALYRYEGKLAPSLYCYVESNRRKATETVGVGRDVILSGNVPEAWSDVRKKLANAAIKEFRDKGATPEDIRFEYIVDEVASFTPEAAEWKKRFPKIANYLQKEADATKQNKAKPYEQYRAELLGDWKRDAEGNVKTTKTGKKTFVPNFSEANRDELNNYAGFRFFSTSDFQIEHFVDLYQVFWDMNLMGVKSHAYTKVEDYVKLFGGTKQKINMSCFAKEDPKTGEIVQDTDQGWDWEKAKEYRKKFPHVGTIIVCANDKILDWAMKQDWIDYCIPFHYSGLSSDVYLSQGWQDFTSTQMEESFDAKPVVGVPAEQAEDIAERLQSGEITEAEASIEYAKTLFENASYGGKMESLFKPETLPENKGTAGSMRTAAQKKWKAMVASGEFKTDDINPAYFKERRTSTAKDKAINPVDIHHVRMYEMGTQKGITDAQGVENYLKICAQERLVPVFPNFMWKDRTIADNAKERTESVKTAKQRWRGIVEDPKYGGHFEVEGKERHWVLSDEGWRKMWADIKDQIDPAFFKTKKDYARTDTPFDVVDPSAIDVQGAQELLAQAFGEGGIEEQYSEDPAIAQKLIDMIKAAEKTHDADLAKAPGKTPAQKAKALSNKIGVDALLAVRNGKDPWAAKTGNQDRNLQGRQLPMAPLYQTAYHGTPYNFDKFTLDHIGGGEGAQAHGWGLYFAQDRDVSEGYRAGVSRLRTTYKVGDKTYHSDPVNRHSWLDESDKKTAEHIELALRQMRLADGNKEDAIKRLRKKAEEWGKENNDYSKKMGKQFAKGASWLEKNNVETQKSSGQVYAVDIPENDVLLDEQKSFAEQPEKVRKALVEMGFSKKSPEEHQRILDEKKRIEREVSRLIEQENAEPTDPRILELDRQYKDLKGSYILDEEMSGHDIYKAVSENLGSDRAASLALNDAGIKGITYDGRQDGRCFVVFDDQAINILNTFYQNKNRMQARGAMSRLQDGRAIVGLFRSKNASTVLHETSHFWLEELRAAAQMENAPEWVKECWEKLQKTYGFEGYLDDPSQFEQWRDVQEDWARQFEAYCREGKAPSEDLQSAFNRFRSWLMDIYKTVKRLLGKNGVNEDVREVFDRLLATQEEIEASQRSATSASAIEEFVGDVAPELRDRYAKAVRMAHDRASLAIANRRLVEQRAAEKEARATAMAELLNSPEYQAISQFRGWGLPFEGLLAAVDEKTANNLRAKWGRWAKEKALFRPMKMSPEKAHAALQDVAEQLNMPTVDDLIGWLLKTPTEKEFIDQSVARSMQEWNAAYDGEVDYSDAMDEALSIELEALTGQKQIGTKSLRREMDLRTGVKKMSEVDAEYKALKAAIRREAQVARKIVADMKKAAAEEKGKLNKAAKEKLQKVKEQERMRRAALAADYRARIEREHIMRQLKKLSASKSIPYEYMLQIRRTMQNWGLLPPSQRIDPVQLRGMPSFAVFMASNSLLEGDEITIPDWIENQERGRPGDLSLDRLREMRDVLGSVAHQGRTHDQMLGAMEKGRISDIAQKCKDQADKLQAIDEMPEESRRSLLEQARAFFRGLLSEMGFVRFMARRLDNYKNTGLFHRVLVFPLQQAQSRELALRKEYTDKLREVLKPLFDHGLQAKQFTIDGVPMNDEVAARWKGLWDMDKVYSVALNMGNAGNLKALTKGYGWTEQDLMKITSRLSSEEWQAIQKIWDTINELYPALNEVSYTLKGAPLPKVEGQSFTVVASDGKIVKMRGGYYPLIFDQTFSDKAAIQQNNDELINGMDTLMRKPNPRDGMTKERKGGTLPPRLSMQVLDRHISDTCHYISFAIPLRDTQRLTAEPAFKQSFIRAMGRENYQQLLPWLRGIARPGNPNAGRVERYMDLLAQRASLMTLGLNLKSSLLQLTSVGNSWSEVGVVPFTKAAFRMILNPIKTVKEVRHHSAYMQARMQLFDDTMRREYDDMKKKDVFGLRLNGRLFSLDSVRQAQMSLIGILDSAVAMPTWIAAYEKAVERGVTEDEAVAEADSCVVAAQGGGGAMDTASLMRSKAWMRVLCPFMSFAMADNARKREAVGGLREWLTSHGQTGISPIQFSRRLAYENMLPVVLTVWLLAVGREGEPPEPEDYFWEALGFHTMGIPFARDIARGMETAFTGKGIGGRTPLALGWMDNMGKGVKDLIKIYRDEGDDKTEYRALKEIVNVAGFFAGVGTPQIWRTIEGSQAYFVDGEGGPLAPALGKPQKK